MAVADSQQFFITRRSTGAVHPAVRSPGLAAGHTCHWFSSAPSQQVSSDPVQPPQYQTSAPNAGAPCANTSVRARMLIKSTASPLLGSSFKRNVGSAKQRCLTRSVRRSLNALRHRRRPSVTQASSLRGRVHACLCTPIIGVAGPASIAVQPSFTRLALLCSHQSVAVNTDSIDP